LYGIILSRLSAGDEQMPDESYSSYTVGTFVSSILTDVKNHHLCNIQDFYDIVRDNKIIPLLTNNYWYFHMYSNEAVIEELSKEDPRIVNA
jgi:hypothetical protein